MRKIVGIHACKQALKTRKPNELIRLQLKTAWSNSPQLKELAELALKKGLKPEEISIKKLNQISQTHQGVLLFVNSDLKVNFSQFSEKSILLILDGIEDPQNLGAIIRTSWLMGVEALILPKQNSVGLTPTVGKVACGGMEFLPIDRVTNISQYISKLKENNFSVYGLDSQAKTSIEEQAFEGPTALVLGRESKGLRPLTQKKCDKILSLPQAVQAASYNVSVSAALALQACIRQKKDL